MNCLAKFFLFLVISLALTACKIDLTINGDGAVSTATDSFDCGAGNTGDCTQHYATVVTDCPGYDSLHPELIPADCTLIVDNINTCSTFTNATTGNCIYDTGLLEVFTAMAGDNSQFINWTGDNPACNGQVKATCSPWMWAEDTNTTAEISIVANFVPDEVEPQEATYQYNYLGQRKSKTVSGTTTYFAYSDVDGQLLGEYTVAGAPIREYVYVDGERVAMFDYSSGTKEIIYPAPNHLGQVFYAWNSSGAPIYQRIQTPFGETMGEYGTAGTKLPVRFPGQYYDEESGFSDNWHRTYDASLGRYLQSDPIGLEGGINTYAYVENNPVMFVDPLGLEKLILFPLGSQAYNTAQAVPDKAGIYSIYGHGGEGFVSSTRNKKDAVYPAGLADVMNKDSNYKQGMPVEVLTCDAGKGDNSVVKQLADLLANHGSITGYDGKVVYQMQLWPFPVAVYPLPWVSKVTY